MDQSPNNSPNIKMENESSELTIMDQSQNGSENMKMENESSEVALDLRKFSPLPRETGGRRTQHDLSEVRNRQQTPTDRSSAANLQLKRCLEFEEKFYGEVKKLKSDEIVFPVQEETPRNEVGKVLVKSSHCINTLQRIMQTINMKREPVSTELPHSMRIDNGIKAEPINLTKTLTTGKSLGVIPSSLSMQSGPVRTQVSAANVDSPDVVIGPNGTRVSKKDLAKINGMEVSRVTRKLLTFVFDRHTLATHTLSGRPWNRFPKTNRPPKPQLDPIESGRHNILCETSFQLCGARHPTRNHYEVCRNQQYS